MTDTAPTELPAAAAPPPRRVPGALRIALYFGNPLAAVGWLLFVAGLGVAAANRPAADSHAGARRWSGAAQLPGRVTDVRYVRGTGSTAHVFAVRYVYVTPDGQTHQGTSFTRDDKYGLGTAPPVQYLPTSPDISRIAGYSSKPFFPWTLMIVPLLGLALGTGVAVYAWRRVRLLRDGDAVWGTVTSAVRTGGEVNRRPRYQLEIGYTARDGAAYSHVFRSCTPDDYTRGRPVLMLCDPREPQRAVPFRAFADVRLDAHGDIVDDADLSCAAWLLVAVLALLASAAFGL